MPITRFGFGGRFSSYLAGKINLSNVYGPPKFWLPSRKLPHLAMLRFTFHSYKQKIPHFTFSPPALNL